MEVTSFANLILNAGTAALVAYTGRQLVKLRRDLSEAASELRHEIHDDDGQA